MVIIGIPHQRDVFVEECDTTAELIQLAQWANGPNGSFSYDKVFYDPASGELSGGGYSGAAADYEIPELDTLIAQGAAKFVVIRGGCYDSWMPAADAPPEEEAALDYLKHDLHAAFAFDSRAEAVEWAATYRGHQWPLVQTLVENAFKPEEKESA